MTELLHEWDDDYHVALQDVEVIPELNGHKDLGQPEASWLIDAADLLAEPDPGPTPWLAQDLIVDEALTAVVGKWKTTKSWALLEIAVSICTGTPAFGTCEIPEPGTVIYVIEESGRNALWRRLDSLCRGRTINPEQLRGKLHLSPNNRIKLDDPDWQNRLLELGHNLKPRAFMFDPLARMKAAARKENEQTDMAVLIEYLLLLRNETNAAPIFVHHQGHMGEHMRGSSDLESAWETRLSVKRDGDNGAVSISPAHRDEEDSNTIAYSLAYDGNTRTMYLRPTSLTTDQRIIDWLRKHDEGGAAAIAKGIEIRRQDVDKSLLRLQEAGTTYRGSSEKRDDLGRPNPNKVWKLSKQAIIQVVPNSDDLGRPTL